MAVRRQSRGPFCSVATDHKSLRAANGARLITLSSIAHRMGAVDFSDMNYDERPYDKWQAYGQAKSAQSLMAVELDRQEKDNGIRSLRSIPEASSPRYNAI